MTEIQPTVTISQAQIDFFHENGYLPINSITTLEEVERLKAIYDEMFKQKAGREDGNQFDLAGADDEAETAMLPQILNPSRYAPELAVTLYKANALAIAKQLLGDDATYGGDHAILKPPGSPAPTPWHQDEAYWDPMLEYQSLSVWMPLQDVDTRSGCMEFIPGSHREEVLPHRSIGGDLRIHGLELAVDYDLSRAVACPLPRGGATLHLSRTLHFTSANMSDRPRRAYILMFGLPPKKRSALRRFPWNEEKHTARQERADAVRTRDTNASR